MKIAWNDLKNQNKHLFTDKKKHEDGFTVTVKVSCDKVIVVAAEYTERFSESDQSAYQETSGVTSVFNNPSEDYVNYIFTNYLSARMMVKTVVDRVVDSDLVSSFKYIVSTPI